MAKAKTIPDATAATPEAEKPDVPLTPRIAAPPPPSVKARVCQQHERAPDGYVRFKMRAVNYNGTPYLYILAAEGGLDAAKDCYLRESGVAAEIERIKDSGAERVPEAVLSVTRLDD